MDDSFLDEVSIGRVDLGQDLQSITFCQLFLLGDVLAKVAVRAVLHDEVVIVSCLDYFMQFDDVLMLEVVVNRYFLLKHVQTVTFKLLQVYHLYRITFVLLDYFDCFVDIATEATA